MFEQRLAWAEQNLARAAELDPADPTPHGYMIDCARGLGRGWQFGDHCFRQALARDPAHRHAHQAMLTILAEKWGGSHGAMFRFANGASQHHPAGSELHVLVILAHLERWLYFSLENDRQGAIRYAQTASVQQEIVEAYDKSLGSPAHRPRRSTVRARSIAAFWFYLAGDKPRLQRELGALGGVCTEFPWCWGESDAAKTYGRARKLAG